MKRLDQQKKWYVLFPVLLFALFSCKNDADKSNVYVKPGNKEMTDLNRYLVQKDRERIQNYIERKKLKMDESPTGLWYLILNNGTGDRYSENDRVVFEYECKLLDGTKCYSSESLGSKEIVLGKTDIESGLDEGIRMLKPGAEAIFIIPPYLAHGFIGDGNKIPARSVIVYNIKILK